MENQIGPHLEKDGGFLLEKAKEEIKVGKKRIRDEKWRNDNRKYISNYCKNYYIKHPDSKKEWNRKNPERAREIFRESKRRARSKITGKLNNAISGRVWLSLKKNKNGAPWELLVGYTVDQLKRHLEKQFLPGMTWGNYGRHGWHIDHIIPVSAFNFKTPNDIDFKKCWALKNLRPLWAKDNHRKRDKLIKNFQPSFSFS